MPVKKRNSYIATQFETREEQESGDLILSGYFIRFDEETELWPGYFEDDKHWQEWKKQSRMLTSVHCSIMTIT